VRRFLASVEDLPRSVIAVPPLARNRDLTVNISANRKLIQYLEAGGVTTVLYGGNAVMYHIPLSEYRETLEALIEAVDKRTWLIPAAGSDYGRLMDQALILRELGFPAALVLPQAGQSTPAGAEAGIRRFADRFGAPVALYLRSEDYLMPANVERLVNDGLVFAIKYAIVRSDPRKDEFLRELVERVEPARVVSGIGERPVVAHWLEFGLRSFTSGSVGIAPGLSTALLHALSGNDLEAAGRIRSVFLPLEDLRDALGPARVLHDAVSLAGIADMGPMLPFMSNLTQEEARQVKPAAVALLGLQNQRAEAHAPA
jgi:dihydrodipicolinate synthase/N-acetylneuraminate lyase